MPDYRRLEQRFTDALGLRGRPVAVAFRDAPPPGLPKFTGTDPSGCSFLRIAGSGRAFYTVPADHYNCAIGSHTHSLPLPPERAQELDQTLSFMAGIGYLRMGGGPAIPPCPAPPRVVIHAPLAGARVDPDGVLFAGRRGRIMLLKEAAARAGV